MPSLTRRDALSLITVGVAGGVLVSRQAFAQGESSAGGLMPGADVCVITPETTEGPFYFDPALDQSDITEGTQKGAPTTVRLQVVDGTCNPIEGARVDIWHCNAEGLYSGYANQTGGVDARGETFLRGTQFAGADGIVEFQTIYPGWYQGRTTHIHFKVFLDERSVLTGQLFFPDELSQSIYETVEPYRGRGSDRRVLNGNDGIARQAGPASVASVEDAGAQYLVSLIIGVDPTART